MGDRDTDNECEADMDVVFDNDIEGTACFETDVDSDKGLVCNTDDRVADTDVGCDIDNDDDRDTETEGTTEKDFDGDSDTDADNTFSDDAENEADDATFETNRVEGMNKGVVSDSNADADANGNGDNENNVGINTETV